MSNKLSLALAILVLVAIVTFELMLNRDRVEPEQPTPERIEVR